MVKIFVGDGRGNSFAGSSGADYMYGDSGNDTLRGNGGTDFLRGSLGADRLDGGDGSDFLDGGENNDTVLGGSGRDILLGLSGNDVVNGGSGVDTISGGLGLDQLTGGSEADRFVFASTQDSTASARDRITDFSTSSGDVIDLSSIDAKAGTGGGQAFSFIGSAAFSGEGQVRTTLVNGRTVIEVNTKGSSGAEMAIELGSVASLESRHFKLSGGLSSDDAAHSVKLGNESANTLSGLGGEDYIYGAGGNDRLLGGGDNDMVRGGSGNDVVDGGAGDDALYGGPGADTFVSTSGSDIIQDFERGVDRIQTSGSFAELSFVQQSDGVMVGSQGAAAQSFSASSLAAPVDGPTFLLAGMDAASLTAADFLFV